MTTDTTAAPEGTPETDAAAESAPVPPHQSPSFLGKIQKWLAGKDKPASPHSEALVHDLRVSVAERDTAVKKMQELDKQARELQTQHAVISGKIDGLASALHRVETHADAG